jgi:hypothetical protein
LIPIYRRSGDYFGFIKSNRLFNANSDYLGWITEDGRVWRADGSFLGELVDNHYIMRRRSMATPARKARLPSQHDLHGRLAKQSVPANREKLVGTMLWMNSRLYNLAGAGDGKKRAAPDQPVSRIIIKRISPDKESE